MQNTTTERYSEEQLEIMAVEDFEQELEREASDAYEEYKQAIEIAEQRDRDIIVNMALVQRWTISKIMSFIGLDEAV